MRRFLKKVAIVSAVAALAALPALVAGQGANIFGLQVQPLQAEPLGMTVVAADTEPVIVIKYDRGGLPQTNTGDSAATVTLATSTLTFTTGGVAYTGFECPVSGAYGGIIDVTNAACNTVGEVVDAINSDVNKKFKAYIAAGLRSDVLTGAIVPDSEDNDVTSPDGEIVYWDSSTLDDNTIVLAPPGTSLGNQAAQLVKGGDKGLIENPQDGYDTVLVFAQENITNAGTVGNFEAYCVVESYARGSAATAGVGSGSSTVQTMYTEAGGATTVLGKIDEFINAGGLRCRDGKIVVRILASGADTSAVLLNAYGYRFKRVSN